MHNMDLTDEEMIDMLKQLISEDEADESVCFDPRYMQMMRQLLKMLEEKGM